MEISWEKWNAIDNARSDLHALFECWSKVGGAGCDGNLDGYLWGVAYGHVQELCEAFDGKEKAAESDTHIGQSAKASEPSGSPADHAMHDELKRRMAELEDAYNNAPVITAGRLRDWRARLGLIGVRVSAALATVERVRELEDLDWQASAPLLLVVDALNQCDDDGAMLQSDVSEFIKRHKEGDGAA